MSDRVLRRGLDYARAGRVGSIERGASTLSARVRGSAGEPYVARLTIDDGGEVRADCTCAFDWEPFCKHAVAVLAIAAGIPLGDGRGETWAAPLPLADEERRVRRERAEKQRFRVRSLDGDALGGRFAVGSGGGAPYTVQIRSLGERLNHCTCADFEHGMLGTCKHIEAVLLAIRRKAPRRFERRAGAPPARALVVVSREDTARIVIRLPARPTAGLERLAARFFDRLGNLRGDPLEALPRFAAAAESLGGVEIHDDVRTFVDEIRRDREATRRREEIDRALAATGGSLPGFAARLYPYQVEGARFLAATGRALLADDMGLGKTVQAIAAAHLLESRGEVSRTLVVCPASLKRQWADEIRRFTGVEARVVDGGAGVRRDAWAAADPVTIANYELVLRDRRWIEELAPDLLILDEAQRIKNWRAKTAEAVKGIPSRFAFVLTGTPLQNRLDDLYSIMQVVDRRVLGPLWSFNDRFFERIGGPTGKLSGYRNLGELRRRLRPVMLRRGRESVLAQLPARIENRYSVALTDTQRDYMHDALQRAARLVALADRRPLKPEEVEQLFRHMQTARMSCNAAGLVDKRTQGSPKLDELQRMIEDVCVTAGRKAVVFTEWESFQRMAAERAAALDVGYVRLHGGVPTAKRGALIERFRDDPDCQLFFSTDAGGVGLNLQWADTVINLDMPWNPAVLDQRVARVHRHGQKNAVHVLLLVAEDSFETRLESVIRGKRELFEAVVLPDAEVDTMATPSGCLTIARAALAAPGAIAEQEDESSPARPTKSDEQHARGAGPVATGSDTNAAEQASAALESRPADRLAQPGERLRELLGPRVERVVRLRSGLVVAVVDSNDEVTREAAVRAEVPILDLAALAATSALGDDSPFAAAEVLFQRDAAPANGRADARRAELLAIARRRLHAAETLLAGELPAEALAQAHAAMEAAVRALDPDAGSDTPHAARLLYEHLVPRGLLDLEHAALVSRADGLARAYAELPAAPPRELVRAVVDDARRIVGA